MIGMPLGRYHVLEKIGNGGMGEVFLAEDTSLRRRVALKFLPPEMQRDAEALKRFVREARSAAALDHPYICHINEVAQAEGRDFIVMEYIDGQTLRTRISRGPLALEEALLVGIEIAEALEAAHGKGIVHRDIKPENVMLTRTGHTKVMDFGLAKKVASPGAKEEAGGPTLTLVTSEGTMAGTLAYMSPEQLRSQPADARSDIWSLGVTLYEMASGARPFRGQNGFEVSSAILNRPPLPLPPGVPAELGAVITRCLEKDPAKRYQAAGDLRAALEAVRAGTAATWAALRYRLARRRWLLAASAVVVVAALVYGLDIGGLRTRLSGWSGGAGRSFKLAVLPFENLSGDPEQEFLSDGLTQDMISELGRLQPARLSVIGQASVMRYKKREAPLEQIARELGVSYALSGTWRREGARVRIAAELIRLRDQTQLWTETYEREMSGMLALQSEVARKVAGALALKLLPSEEAKLARVRSVDPTAYEAYLKGIQHRDKLTKDGFDAAEFYFNLALDRDANYAAAWAGLAGIWNSRLQLGMSTRQEALPKAKEAARKAVELDDTEIEAHRILAGILTWAEWDFRAAELEWNRTFEIDPNFATGLSSYAHFLMVTDRPESALETIERAVELDPYSIRIQSFYAQVLLGARRYDEVIAVARRVLRDQPGTGVAMTALTAALFKKGLVGDLMALEREHWAKDAELVASLDKGYDEAGYAGAIKGFADALTARYGKPGGQRAYVLANVWAQVGDKGRVIEWLSKAFEDHDNNMPYIGTNPLFDLVRDDPRFHDLMRRIGLPR